jgi:putative ABC transport system permease protein
MSTQALAAAIVTAALFASHSLNAAHLDRTTRNALSDSGILDVAALFLLISIYLSIIIVGVTMTGSIARQARDIALVRAVGASPWQVRRAVALQAAVVAVPATVVGSTLGLPAARLWITGLVGHGIIPPTVSFQAYGGAVPVALGVTVGTSLIGALFAAARPSRVRPAVALAETGAPRLRAGVTRTVLGLLLVGGGVFLSILISGWDAETADAAGLGVMLAMCVGAGLLGPALLRVAAPVTRLFGATGVLAADNIAVRAKAYSGALVPLTLATAFAAVTVLRETTATHVTGVAPSAASQWLNATGTGVYTAFAAVAALNALITVILARRRDLAVVRLAGCPQGRALGIVICEALCVTGTALLVAAAVAATTMLPLLHTALHTWVPWAPAGYWFAGVAGVTALVLAGTVLPAALAMRTPPIEAVG